MSELGLPVKVHPPNAEVSKLGRSRAIAREASIERRRRFLQKNGSGFGPAPTAETVSELAGIGAWPCPPSGLGGITPGAGFALWSKREPLGWAQAGGVALIGGLRLPPPTVSASQQFIDERRPERDGPAVSPGRGGF